MTDSPAFEIPCGFVRLRRQVECRDWPLWQRAFTGQLKDSRYYEIVADTLGSDFDCRVLVVENAAGEPVSLQPCFFVEQDLVATAPTFVRIGVQRIRRWWPSLLRLRMLMIGCPAGEGHLTLDPLHLPALAATLPAIARCYGASLIVWKDAPAKYRDELAALGRKFPRLASMPATILPLGFTSFDDYAARALSHAMRKNLRRKFRALTAAPPLEMTVTSDLTGVIDEAHALYLQVFARSSLQFERLTKEFLLNLGQRLPEHARFFLWRQEGRLIAFSVCLIHEGVLSDEYLGLDYRVAHELSLYFVTFRDVLSWALANGLKAYSSTPLNYDPKLHLGFHLAPLDLYVAAAAQWMAPFFRLALPWIEPTQGEPLLRQFPNAEKLLSPR
jgi:hypothetical protein